MEEDIGTWVPCGPAAGRSLGTADGHCPECWLVLEGLGDVLDVPLRSPHPQQLLSGLLQRLHWQFGVMRGENDTGRLHPYVQSFLIINTALTTAKCPSSRGVR